MHRLYEALYGAELKNSRKVRVERFFMRGSTIEATVVDERVRTCGTYTVVFNDGFSCSCGRHACEHIFKVLLEAEKHHHAKARFKGSDYFYIRKRNSIKRFDLRELGLESVFDNYGEHPTKEGYTNTRIASDTELIGVEFESYGPKRNLYEEYNAVIFTLKGFGWKYEMDGSLPSRGGEIKSPPFPVEDIHLNTKRLNLLRELSCTGEYAGLHVHVSAGFNEHLPPFFNFAYPTLAKVEKLIDLPALFGRNFNGYADRLSPNTPYNRYRWLNLTNIERSVPTVEVRGGSINAPDYEALIWFAIGIKDLVKGLHSDFVDGRVIRQNLFSYMRPESLEKIEPFVKPEARMLVWRAIDENTHLSRVHADSRTH